MKNYNYINKFKNIIIYLCKYKLQKLCPSIPPLLLFKFIYIYIFNHILILNYAEIPI